MEYDNTNSGVIFKNEERKTDKHPEYGGSLNVEGKDFWVSAWVKESTKTGKKFFSLSVKPKGDSFVESAATSAINNDDIESQIPF